MTPRSLAWIAQHNFGTAERPLWLEAEVDSMRNGEEVDLVLVTQGSPPVVFHEVIDTNAEAFSEFVRELTELDPEDVAEVLDEAREQHVATLAAGMGDFALGLNRLAAMRAGSPSMAVGQDSLVRGKR